MLTVLIAPFGLATLLLAQTPAPAKPTPEQVQAPLADLAAAYADGQVVTLANALERASLVPDRKVVKAVSRALKDKRPEVRSAAISAFFQLDHPDALAVLHKLARDRKWMKDPDTAAAILRAVGNHADPSSIKVLTRGHDQTPQHGPMRARVFGLGNIRDKDSVDALIELMSLGGRNGNPRAKRRYAYLDGDFRLSLIVLTGVDQGTSPELWARWWRKNKKGFELSEQPAPLPRSLRYRWDRYWGRDTDYSRDEKREDRGG